MRLKRSRLKIFHHRPVILKKDKEGNIYAEYGTAETFLAEEWSAGGKMQQELYGLRLPNIRTLRLEGNYKECSIPNGKTYFKMENGLMIAVGDGVCFSVGPEQEPDYRIQAVYPYRFLTLEVEKI